MEPNRTQAEKLGFMAGARRFVWNWALAQRRNHYQQTGKSLPWPELSRQLTELKQQADTAWLKDADSQALQQAVKVDLRRAFVNFFQKRAHYPRFKSRKRDGARFCIPQRVSVVDGRVTIPKVGTVTIRQSQPIEGETKSATFKQDAIGHWYVTLVSEFEMPDTTMPPAKPELIIGVDLGLHDFAVCSDGTRVPAPKFARRAQRYMRRFQRCLSRRIKGSRRRTKARVKVARLHQRITCQRNDFLHKLTTSLVRKYEGVCIEDLSTKGLARTKLSRSVLDAAFGGFRRQLEYKTVWRRRHLAVIDRWYPSSKTCHDCGAINQALTLADRSWICMGCGVLHDRDSNASLNIRYEGLKLLVAAGHAETKNARGPDVRLPHSGVVGVEARIPRL
jgi:putative transposase